MACGTDLPTLLSRARVHDAEAVEALARLIEARLLLTMPRPRGGDQRAAERARCDAALRQLAAMMGADMPTEQLARDMAGRWRAFWRTAGAPLESPQSAGQETFVEISRGGCLAPLTAIIVIPFTGKSKQNRHGGK